MLSRSTSNAAERLKQIKSSSSTHTASPGNHRASVDIGPVATRYQAEIAAVKAYSRAAMTGSSSSIADRTPQPVPQRRKSQRAGRTEGSHFEDARLGRRRSTSVRPDHQSSRPSTSKHRVAPVPKTASESSGEERVVTRKRSVIPPSVSQDQRHITHAAPPVSNHRVRKTQSMYTDGSPTPRNHRTPDALTPNLQLPDSISSSTDGYNGSVSYLSYSEKPSTQVIKPIRPSVRETQTDEEILALARDKCLLDFQQNNKVRERRSFILGSFQRRRPDAAVPRNSRTSYDNSLPPFNYADETAIPSLPTAPAPSSPQYTVVQARKTARTFSDTLKGRISKVFRRASKAPAGLPVQHVEAKHFHYAASEEAYHSLSERKAGPFKAADQDTLAVLTGNLPSNGDSANSRTSTATGSNAKSRVTSWADSTMTGTFTSRLNAGYGRASATEHNSTEAATEMHSLRKAASFFGGPVRNKLRRASKVDLKSSEESQALYSALRDRIVPPQRAETSEGSVDKQPQAQAQSALESLPSRRNASLSKSSGHRYSTSTIRTVTPDPTAYRLKMPSPVAEVRSPQTASQPESDEEGDSERIKPVRRRPVVKAALPSQEQIASRVEKAKNRWQSPLSESSYLAPRTICDASPDDNPYELPSLRRNVVHPVESIDIPHCSGARHHTEEASHTFMSPSIYSRATDGASPRPMTPTEGGVTVVKIIGQETRTYSISPPKQEQAGQRPVQTSGQWRRWLSDELGSFKGDTEDITLTNLVPRANGDSASSPIEMPSTVAANQADQSKASSGSHPSAIRPPLAVSGTRSKANRRRSSFMNERYPLIESGRHPSDKSEKSRPRSSFNARDRSSSCEAEIEPPAGEQEPRKPSWIRPRVVTNRQSIARMETTAHAKTQDSKSKKRTGIAPVTDRQADIRNDHAANVPQGTTRATTRYKSAFELRANYKDGNTGHSTPTEIYRKPVQDTTNSILEDTTIRNISAGPYASQHSIRPTSDKHADTSSKENTPPPENNSLPALSSSEWLSAGPRKLRKPITAAPAHGRRSVSRCSLAKSMKDGQGSPAQRMASQWLEKRSRESTPAFI